MRALPFLHCVLKPISCPRLLCECYSGRHNNSHSVCRTITHRQTRGYEPTIPYKYDSDFCLQCKTASKPGSETSISGLKINKWAEEAPLLCRGRTRSVLSPKISQYTGTPREVQAERTFHIWMTETFNHFINIHHHSIFYSSFNHRINTKLRERIQGCTWSAAFQTQAPRTSSSSPPITHGQKRLDLLRKWDKVTVKTNTNHPVNLKG